LLPHCQIFFLRGWADTSKVKGATFDLPLLPLYVAGGAVSFATMRTKRTISLLRTFFFFVASLHCVAQSAASRPSQIASHSHQAQDFLKQNRPDLAIPEFRAIIALDPNNVDARGNLGVLLFFQGDYPAAIPQFRAALKLRPALWKIRALLGMAEKRTGDFSAARLDLEKAFPKLEEEKIKIESGMELIELYSGIGDLEKAATIVDALASLYPTNPQVLYTSYRIHSDLSAQAMLSLSIVAPKSALTHQMMAHELSKHGDTEAAINNYREALQIDPNSPGLHFELAELLNSAGGQGAQEEAKKEYEAALAGNKLDEKSECRLGDIAYREGDMAQSQAHYSRAIELQPDDPDANIGLARVLMEMKQTQKAQTLLEHTIQLDPTIPLAHFRLSTIYRQEGKADDAKHEVEQYQKYKDMKEKIRDLYREMRLQPVKPEIDEPDARK
jgi:Tfp pilus assembly protein PilF